MVALVAVGYLGVTGIGSVRSDLLIVQNDNVARSAQAEVDASHDNERWALLDYMRSQDEATTKQATADLDEGVTTIAQMLDEVDKANLGPSFVADTKTVRDEANAGA